MNRLMAFVNARGETLIPIGVFTVGFLILLGLRIFFTPVAFDNLYFQPWSSEDLMQTVSIVDLKNEPFRSILYLHIQPPLFDTIRILLLQFASEDTIQGQLRQVDTGLYNLSLLLYATMGWMISKLLLGMKANLFLGFFAPLVFYLHPATVFYATLLDGTFLTSFGVLWLFYSLSRLPKGGSIWMTAIAFLFLFSLRSIFQWPALLITITSLVLLKVQRRKIVQFSCVIGIFVFAFMTKQFLLFGITSTSSYFGSSCLHALGYIPEMGKSVINLEDAQLGPAFPRVSQQFLPAVLTRTHKLTGAHNFNNLADLHNERELVTECITLVSTQPVYKTLTSIIHNMMVFFHPSSEFYTPHLISDALPWRSFYNSIFSGIPFITLITGSCVCWLLNHDKHHIRNAMGLVLPSIYIFIVCILFEKVENFRYKYFIEPLLILFIITQFASFFSILWRYIVNRSLVIIPGRARKA